jgi:solute carrier family 25 S-adenosylmethionine transporter 26
MPLSEFTVALLSGGCAGFAVDISLYPLDTFKTRAQSKEGFFRAGGFKGAFKGLGPAAVGSFPGAALFFATYENVKFGDDATAHLTAASIGEMVACLVRVPTENLKQNMQANRYATLGAAFSAIRARGWAAFYNGYGSTILREIPFSCIQFPIWEAGKKAVARRSSSGKCSPLMSAALGSASGAFAAACTTPLDVIKTRLMTSPDAYTSVGQAIRKVYAEEGFSAFFKGIEPRVMWIGIGGFVFFGAYEEARRGITTLAS